MTKYTSSMFLLYRRRHLGAPTQENETNLRRYSRLWYSGTSGVPTGNKSKDMY